jgi:predicted CXXCH cytochrome family protein
MVSGKPSFVFLSLLACTGFLLNQPFVAAQTQAPLYVGSDACVACHDDAASTMADSAHGKLAEEKVAARRGCEACHGPGSNHVNSGGDKSLLFSFKGASAAAIRRQCAACHESAPASVHTHRRTTCLSCHAAHHYREKKFLLVEATPQLCTNCHDRR